MDIDRLTSKKNSKINEEVEKVDERMMETYSSGGSSTSSSGTSAYPAKSFVSILEEGCRKYYDGTAPIFIPTPVETVSNMLFL